MESISSSSSKGLQLEHKEIATLLKLQSDPAYVYQEVLGAHLWDKQQEAADAIEKYDRVAIRSCHASGKTWLLSRVVLRFLLPFPDTIIVTTAPTWKQVEMALWRDIRSAIAEAPVDLGLKPLQTRIDLGPKWYAFGLSTDTPEHFQGIHSAKLIMVIADESSGIYDKIFESIDGILAGGHSKLVMIGNPNKAKGRFADSFKDPSFQKIHISAFDTPNVKAKQVVIPGLITYEWVEEMRLRYGEDSDVWRVRVLGDLPKGGDDVLVSVDEVEAAMGREAEQKGVLKICVDVARYGSDATAIVVRQGDKVIEALKFYSLPVTSVAGKVKEVIHRYESAQKVVGIDEGNMGSGVIDILRAENYEIQEIVFGSSPINDKDEVYMNLRAQMYSRFKDGIKTLALPKLEDWYQACDIKYFYNSKGKLQIEEKKKIKARGLSSPDLIDALVMTYYPFEEKRNERFTSASHLSF